MTDSQESLLPLNEPLDLDGRPLVLEKRLASGLTGEVYRGRLGKDNQAIPVAVKAMKTLAFKGARQYFDAEGSTLNLIRGYEEDANENQKVKLRIAPEYYGKGENEDVPFLVMEFIEGEEIPGILHREGRLPEAQALIAAWHLYRTLDIMHTRLRMTYIDLKLENLWWVGDAATGQLKMTDFGTLEKIPGDPADPQNYAAQRGIRRDSLLAGVYLMAMLTGHTLNYSMGELRGERPAQEINRSQYLGWGTQDLLKRILHHNPQARLTDPGKIAIELERLVERWQESTNQLVQRSQRYLNRAAQDPESEEGFQRAREARISLGIAALRADADQASLEPLIAEAERILKMSDYLERGRAIFYGRSYSAAREVFENGRDWSDEIVLLSWWSYLARIGEDIPAAAFDNETRTEAVKVVEVMQEGYGGKPGSWEHAYNRLKDLQKRIDCEGLQLLQTHALIFGELEKVNGFDGPGQFASQAAAYQTAYNALKSLPKKEKEVLAEEVGEILPLFEQADYLAKTRGQATTKLNQAQMAMQNSQLPEALALIQEAITLDRENEMADKLLLAAAQKTLAAGDYSTAAEYAWTTWMLPRRDPAVWNIFAQADLLLKARSAIPGLDQNTFFDNLRRALAGNGPAKPVAGLLDEAAPVAEEAGDVEFLRALSVFAARPLADEPRAAEFKQRAEGLDKEIQAERRQTVDRAIRRAGALFSLNHINDRRNFHEFYQDLTMEKYLAYLNQRRPALQEACTILEEAAAVSLISNNFLKTEIIALRKNITADLDGLEALTAVEAEQMLATKGELQQREQTLAARALEQETTGDNGEEFADPLRGEYEKLVVDCFKYLTTKDTNDGEVRSIRDNAAAHLDWFGLAGWQALQSLSAGHLQDIQNRLQEAEDRFLAGDLPAAANQISFLQRIHGGGAQDWQPLAGKIHAGQEWQKWLDGHKSVLTANTYNPAVLQELRRFWLPFKLPELYWRESAVAPYMQTMVANAPPTVAKKLGDLRYPDFIRTFRVWFDLEMTAQMTPGEADNNTKRQWPGLAPFLDSVVRAGEKGIEPMQSLLRTTAPPPEFEETLVTMGENAWSAAVQHVRPPRPEPKPREGIHPLFYTVAAVLMIIICSSGSLLAWGYRGGGPLAPAFLPSPEKTATAVAASATANPATPVPPLAVVPLPTAVPTFIPSPTATHTPEPTPTETSTPTETPVPILAVGSSDYSISGDGVAEINPRVPIMAVEYWLLSLENTKGSHPFSDTAVWGQENLDEIGPINYINPSVGPVDIVWEMDTYLNEGLYQLYVLDTIQQSGGAHAFQILLDGEPVEPYLGTGEVIFQHPEDGGQEQNAWLPLGAYEVATGQTLSINTQVAGGEERPLPFAAPYILIAQVGEREKIMLDKLPFAQSEGKTLYSLLDDQNIDLFRLQSQQADGSYPASPDLDGTYWGSYVDSPIPIWNGSFRSGLLQNGRDVGHMAVWPPVGRLPSGKYELRAWMPAEHATAYAEYKLIIDGEESNEGNPRTILQSAQQDDWFTLGEWVIAEDSSVSVQVFALHSENLANNPAYAVGEDIAELGVDAVVLLRLDDQ